MRIPAALLCFAIAGCVTGAQLRGPQPTEEERDAAVRDHPICAGDRDCAAKWAATQLWIVHNSAYKLQIATDVVIETYQGEEPATGLAMRATKEPVGAGRFRIDLNVWCANVYRCDIHPVRAIVAFNREIASIVE